MSTEDPSGPSLTDYARAVGRSFAYDFEPSESVLAKRLWAVATRAFHREMKDRAAQQQKLDRQIAKNLREYL